MRKKIVGVMGAGDAATEKDKKIAYELGALVAKNGWILLSGGRNVGVMDAVNKGAKSVGCLTIGIIPSKDNKDTSEAVDIAIVTGMGGARNVINILSSDIIVACGMGAGTLSEIAFALKAKKYVILINDNVHSKKFLQSLDNEHVKVAENAIGSIKLIKKLMQ